MGFSPGGGGSSSVGSSTDVALNNPADSEALVYDGTTGKWKNAAVVGTTGPAGPQGPQGATGPQGPAGGSVPIVILEASEWAAIDPGVADTLYVVVPDGSGPSHVWLVTDDFTANEAPPASTDTGQSWTVISGAWSTSGGALSAAADGAQIAINLSSTSQTVETTWSGTVGASSNPTLTLRSSLDGTVQYRIEKVNTSELRIAKRTPSSTTLWQSSTGVVGTGSRVRATIANVSGTPTLHVYVNDVEITPTIGVTDSGTMPSGTYAGLRYGFTSAGNTYGYDSFKADNQVVLP